MYQILLFLKFVKAFQQEIDINFLSGIYNKGDEMKILLFIGLAALLSNCACSLSEDDFMNNGTITGYDIRECSCCGGFFIDIENITYRFYDLPANSGLDLTDARFPVYVKLDWQNDPNACLGDEIIVLKIESK